MDLMAAADELYALRPEEFVGRRNEVVKEAKAAGDKALSEEIKKLPKPTAAAWAINMLVRHEPDQVEQVLDLGAALRDAQESMAGEELRQLGRQRRQLTAAVTRQARALASDLGVKIAEPVAVQVEETLHAAMVDPDAATAVRTGMLVKPLTAVGSEAEDVAEAVAIPSALGETVVRRAPRRAKEQPPAKPELAVVADNTRAIEEAEAEVAAAQERLAEAERRLSKAQGKVEKREARALQLQAELDELRRRVTEVEAQVEANEDELSDAEELRQEREAALDEARAALERSRTKLEGLR